MSLASQISALASRIGAEFKTARSEMAAQRGIAPADLGFIAWTYDPQPTAGTGSSPFTAGGTLEVQRLRVPKTSLITNLHVYVQTAGATLTAGQCLAGLYDANGNLLSATGDQSTAWQSTGLKTMALTTPQTIAAGWYDVAVFYRGTTGPAFVRGTSYAFSNGLLTGSNLRSARAATGNTTTMPAALGAKTASTQNYWAALS